MNSFQKTIQTLQEKVYRRGINYSLDRILSVLTTLDNPHTKLPPIIHIAGTNGKGSTLAFIKAALMADNLTVGTFTSPHITSYCERIQTNNDLISKENFATLFNKVNQADPNNTLTEFEVLTVMSYLYFSQNPPNFCLYETGLGGKLDTSNVITPKITIITKIALDHQAILGNTIEEITQEKAGIIKPKTPIITISTQDPKALDIITQTAKQKNAPLHIVDPTPVPSHYQLQGHHQTENLALAKQALDLLGVPESGLASANSWGRFTILNQTTIIDAAHNPSAMQVLFKNIQTHFPNQAIHAIVGFSKDKDHKSMLDILTQHCDSIQYCEFDPQLAILCSKIQETHPEIPQISFSDAKIFTSPLTLLTGSIYFISKFKVDNAIIPTL